MRGATLRLAVLVTLLGAACATPASHGVHRDHVGDDWQRVVRVVPLVSGVASTLGGEGGTAGPATADERAHSALAAALVAGAGRHPLLEPVPAPLLSPPSRATLSALLQRWDEEVAALVAREERVPETFVLGLGPGLGSLLAGIDADALLLARGVNVPPLERFARGSPGYDADRTVRRGELSVLLALVELPSGDVLWMAHHRERTGSHDLVVTWRDLGRREVADEIVGELLQRFPGSGE